MSKHTPGPWIFEERVAGFDILAPESVYYVAEYLGVDCGVIDNIADACLIAAAPELLEALENLLKVHEGEGGTQHNAADMARAALAKAKGEDAVPYSHTTLPTRDHM